MAEKDREQTIRGLIKGKKRKITVSNKLKDMNKVNLYRRGFLKFTVAGLFAGVTAPVLPYLSAARAAVTGTGKTIIPFSTHLGSGLGRSVKDISKLCTKSTIQDGLAIWGSNAKNAQNEVSDWLRRLRVISIRQ